MLGLIKSRKSPLLLASASFAAVTMLAATSAYGQASGQPGADPAGQGVARADESQAGSGEILVTAQRRSERLRDVPLSITAFSGEQLQEAGIRDTQSLTSTTPGLKMDKVGNFTIPAIRGITSQVSGPGVDTNVAIYVDGVYQPAANANTFDIPDVERIEVLKGPQGTLFGRNATGGALQIITREPSYTIAGNLVASYGSFNDKLVKGFVSLPVVDERVAISIAGSYEENDGYLKDFITFEDAAPFKSHLIRGKIRFDPTDSLKIVVTAFESKRQDTASSFSVPLNGNTVGRLIPGTLIPPGDPYLVTINPIARQVNINKAYGGDATVTWDIDAGKFKSITAFGNYTLTNPNDTDASLQPPGKVGILYTGGTTDKFFSQEASFASSLGGKFNFVIGGYYSDGWGGWTPLNVLSDTFPVSIASRQDITALAAFGEVYFNPTERLSLIAGLRYSHERRTLTSALYPLGGTVPLSSLTPALAHKSWSSATPRFSIKYELTPTSNVYFTYSKGFKSGIFQTSATRLQSDGSLPLADPEKIDAYEVGFKGKIGDIIDLSLAAYHYNYKDLQVTAFTCVNQGPGVPCVNLSVLTNAGAARINGLEIDATIRPTVGLSLRTGVSLLDAKYTDFKDASRTVPNTDINGVPLQNGNTTQIYDASGNRMLRAPTFTISETLAYRTNLAGGDLAFTGTAYHTNSINYTVDGRLKQKPYTTLDARVSWSPENSGLTLAVFGNNLTNELRLGSVFSADTGDAVSYLPPRTWGVEASYRF
jgi:iron complex outermembrane recepter protein